MSSASIEFDFEKARAQAKRLEDIAADMKKLSNIQISDTMDQLSTNWKGESERKFLGKSDLLRGNITSTANEINEIAANIRKTAKQIYDAEMRALSIARTKSGK